MPTKNALRFMLLFTIISNTAHATKFLPPTKKYHHDYPTMVHCMLKELKSDTPDKQWLKANLSIMQENTHVCTPTLQRKKQLYLQKKIAALKQQQKQKNKVHFD